MSADKLGNDVQPAEQKFRARLIRIKTGEKSVVINESDAEEMMLRIHDRVVVTKDFQRTVAMLDISQTVVEKGEIGFYEDFNEFPINEGDLVEVSVAPTPTSVEFIRKKMKGKTLTKSEIHSIVKDTVFHNLSKLEVAAFLMAEEYVGMDMDEIESLAKAMVETGKTIDFGEQVVDKHSIGGVPGNKVTLLIVPIVAA
ncbi:MAG: thymidine phosphorylase, partial [Candidatus Methanosuratincola sp.]